MLLDATDSQLVLVDYQDRLMAAIAERESVLANARRLAQAARLLPAVSESLPRSGADRLLYRQGQPLS